ncbi:uncharacterized protein YpiB (UPF0302 family) [Bacillus fengqiuensis]|nr:uncharacterized protein YpiB (UPF0302 family) [Bacillus fengqiuensis]
MEKYLLNVPVQSEVNVMDALFAEIVLDKSLYDFRKQQIQQKIDHSLQNRHKDEFLRLTEELKNIS